MSRERRDPRAEQSRRRRGETPAPAETPPARRERPDPHAAESGEAAAGTRVRRDPRVRQVHRVRQTGTVETPEVVIVEAPEAFVLAVPDIEGGRIEAVDRAFLATARWFADRCGAALAALTFRGQHQDALAHAGVDRWIGLEIGDEYAPETEAAACVAAIAKLNAQHILFPDLPTGGGDLGRRVAATLGESPATNVYRLATGSVSCRGGGVDLDGKPPRVLLLGEHAMRSLTNEKPHEARAVELAPPEVPPRIRDQGPVAVDTSAMPLREAPFIVAAGQGVRDWQSFRRLARALGATVGGSRVVCDAGHLARDRQVGASGTIVQPRCYMALGISGAPQHLQGIDRCERVVAINTDPHCDMIRRADLAVVADVHAVMPALLRLMDGDA